jgi:hypothetical protein
MAEIVYALSAILSILCTALLFRAYRINRSSLLRWSSVAFALLTLNNLVLFADLVLFPDLDFGGGLLRNITGAAAGSLLLYGLIWEVT